MSQPTQKIKKYTHVCPTEDGGCGKTYSSIDPDPYFCPTCVNQRKDFYASIEKKVASTRKAPVKSDLQIYDELCKASGTKFPRA